MKICVFCSSASGLAQKYVDAAEETGRLIGGHGHELVFGGFETGTMGSVARACKAAGGRVTGAIVGKRGELPGRPVFDCDRLEESPDLGERKVWMAQNSDAFVVLPGAFGTLDEFYDVVAVKKMMGSSMPVVLVNVDGFWDPIAQLDERMVADGFMSESCRELYAVAQDAAQAIAIVEAQAAKQEAR